MYTIYTSIAFQIFCWWSNRFWNRINLHTSTRFGTPRFAARIQVDRVAAQTLYPCATLSIAWSKFPELQLENRLVAFAERGCSQLTMFHLEYPSCRRKKWDSWDVRWHQLSCLVKGVCIKNCFLGDLVPFVLNMPLAGDHFVPTPKRVAERAPRRLLEFGGCGSKQNQWQQCKWAGKKGWDTSTKAAPNACRGKPCHHLGQCMTKFQMHFIQP